MVRCGCENAVHQPEVAEAPEGRNEATNRPKVGTVHSTVRSRTSPVASGEEKERRTAFAPGSAGAVLMGETTSAGVLTGSAFPCAAARCCTRPAARLRRTG